MNFKQKLIQIALGALGSVIAAAVSFIANGDVPAAVGLGAAANLVAGTVANNLFA